MVGIRDFELLYLLPNVKTFLLLLAPFQSQRKETGVTDLQKRAAVAQKVSINDRGAQTV